MTCNPTHVAQSRKCALWACGFTVPVKRHRGAGTHTGHTRDTRAHKGTRITPTNLTTIQTHQHTVPSQRQSRGLASTNYQLMTEFNVSLMVSLCKLYTTRDWVDTTYGYRYCCCCCLTQRAKLRHGPRSTCRSTRASIAWLFVAHRCVFNNSKVCSVSPAIPPRGPAGSEGFVC